MFISVADNRKTYYSQQEIIKQLDESYEGRGVNTQPAGSVWKPGRIKDYHGLVKPAGRTPEEEQYGIELVKKLQAMKVGDSEIV